MQSIGAYVYFGQPWSVHIVKLVLSHDLIVMLMRDDGRSLWIIVSPHMIIAFSVDVFFLKIRSM